MGQKFKETLDYLGPRYYAKIIDCENCICRDLGDYEFEISGLSARGKYKVNVYVWKDKKQIVRSVYGIHSKEELLKCLETLTQELPYPESQNT